MTASSVPAPAPASLGHVVRRARLAHGLSQEALAARVTRLGSETKQSDISRIESGRVSLPRRQRLAYLALALDLPLSELLAASHWASDGEPSLMLAPGAPFSLAAPAAAWPMAARPEPPPAAPGGSAGLSLRAEVDSTAATVLRLRASVARARDTLAQSRALIARCQQLARTGYRRSTVAN